MESRLLEFLEMFISPKPRHQTISFSISFESTAFIGRDFVNSCH